MITPMDIHNREFTKGFRGYVVEEVDTFLTQVASDYEAVFRDNREMKETIEQLREKLAHYEQMESTMNNTLVLAQETAENVKAAARKEADLIIQGAEQQKQHMVRDTAHSLREGQEKYDSIRNDVAVFRAKMESLLQSQLQLLNQIELPEGRINTLDKDGADLNANELAEETVAEEKQSFVSISEVDETDMTDILDNKNEA